MRFAFLASLATVLLHSCAALTPAQRAQALLAQMNMTEKFTLLGGSGGAYVVRHFVLTGSTNKYWCLLGLKRITDHRETLPRLNGSESLRSP